MSKSKSRGRSCTRRREASKPEVTLLDTPISSPFDQKKYRAIQLQNGLKVLLVQDVSKANKKLTEPFHLADSDPRLNQVAEEEEDEEIEKEEVASKQKLGENQQKKRDVVAQRKRRSALNVKKNRKMRKNYNCNNKSVDDSCGYDNRGYKSSYKSSYSSSRDSGSAKESEKQRKSESGGSETAAAALTVGVGSACDPEDLPGLAHLLEHSIFLGCKGFPGEADFDKYLNDNGGESNASTDFERTTFQFNISLDALKPALQRFVQFFVSPLLLVERVKREIAAVDSEFCERKQNDNLRLIQVLKTTIQKHHPMASLGDGNRKSLDELPSLYGINIADALKDYFQKYFCASNMGLVIQAAKTLDTLEKWVNSIFMEIPANGTAVIPDFSTDFYRLPFDPLLFSQAFKIVPVAAVEQLDVAWVLPPMKQKWREKAIDFIYFLLSNDGHGSLLQYLRRRLWCMQIMYGFEDSEFEKNSCCTLLTLSFSLTYEGQRHVLGIMSALFHYINMLRTSMTFELGRVYEERKQMLDILFTWQEEEDATDYVSKLSPNLLEYPSKNVLSGETLWRHFDAELVKGVLERLSPANANFTWTSKSFSKNCTEREKWYGVAFCRWEDDLLTEWRRRAEEIWSSKATIKDFALPQKNKYIPSNFDLLEESKADKDKEEPRLIKKDAFGKLWWKIDDSFAVPQSCAFFRLTPDISRSAFDFSMINLLVEILNNNLSAELYEAAICGLNGSLENAYCSLVIVLEGFHHKLPVLLCAIVDELASLLVSESTFQNVLTELRRRRKVDSCIPETLAEDLRATILTSSSITMVDEMTMLKDVTLAHFSNYAKSFRSRFFNEALVCGNITSSSAEEMFNYFQQRLRPLPLPREPPAFGRQSVQLPLGTSFCRVGNLTLGSVNGVVLNYFQIGRETPTRKVMAKILTNIMGQPLFAALRTREQLGYTVFCDDVVERNVVGFLFEVHYESHKFSSFHINQRLEVFLREFFDHLEKMNHKTFEGFVLDVFASSLSSYVNLVDVANELWDEILSKQYKFRRCYDEAEIAISLSKKRLIEFATKIFISQEKKEKNANAQILKHKSSTPNRISPIRHFGIGNMKTVTSLGRRVKLPKQLTMTQRLVRAHKEIEGASERVDNDKRNLNNNAENPSTSGSTSGSVMSRRKLSINVLGYGHLEERSMSHCAPSSSTTTTKTTTTTTTTTTSAAETSEEDNNNNKNFQLEFVPSEALYPKSQHIVDIESFRAKLYLYPLETTTTNI